MPLPVLERIQESILEFEGEGLGLFEVPHRGKKFENCIEEIKEALHRLLEIPSSHEVIFIGAGASLQFSMIPLNFSLPAKENYYLLSGSWSKAAFKEAESIVHARSAGSSEEIGFRKLPRISEDISNAAYLHYTSNNTIFGTQFSSPPEVKGTRLICDASSDILSRPVSLKDHAAIYAGAQKNLGTPGVTILIINKDMVPASLPKVPKMLQYNTYLESNSLYNTPPVSAILVVREMLRWIESSGGLSEMEKRNKEKAKRVYEVLDKSRLYVPYADSSARSLMNVTFTLSDASLEASLIGYLEKENCIGLKGHRSVGGFRISLYNAITLEDVDVLCGVLREFEKTA